MNPDQEISDTFQIVIGILVCIALIYFFAMYETKNDFIRDCMTGHTELECKFMWSDGND